VHRSIRNMTVAATIASTLAFAPAALAGGGITPDNRADRTGPAGLKASAPDTTGVGLIHASMVTAEVAARASTASTDTGFQWADAGVGAAAGIAAALAGAGIATGVRGRRRITA